MRKLWPPTHDRFSIRVWAAIISFLLTLGFVVLALLCPQADSFYMFFVPGLLPVLIITGGWFSSLAPLGIVLMLALNMAFYFLVAWWLISAFEAKTNWWPAKPL
jgi:hypothetical protein